MNSRGPDVVIHQGALGDGVLLWPLLRGLNVPVLVTTSSKGRLAARCLPGVRALDIERRAFSSLHGPEPATEPGDELDVLRSAGRIISFVSDGSDAWAVNVRALAPRATMAFIQPRPPCDWRGHVGDFHLRQLREQGVEVTPRGPEPGGDPRGPIILHSGSGGAGKVWPLERWAELVEQLRHRGYPVRCVIGEVECERMTPEWQARLEARRLTTLDELCDELLAARQFVGHDSGPTHLAAQLGLPTLALFGPSDASQWSPRGPAVRVLAPPTPRDMRWLSVEDVANALGAS